MFVLMDTGPSTAPSASLNEETTAGWRWTDSACRVLLPKQSLTPITNVCTGLRSNRGRSPFVACRRAASGRYVRWPLPGWHADASLC